MSGCRDAHETLLDARAFNLQPVTMVSASVPGQDSNPINTAYECSIGGQQMLVSYEFFFLSRTVSYVCGLFLGLLGRLSAGQIGVIKGNLKGVTVRGCFPSTVALRHSGGEPQLDRQTCSQVVNQALQL